MTRARSFVCTFAALFSIGCGGGGGTPDGEISSFLVVDFLGQDSDGYIRRDQPLEIVFSRRIDPGSVSVEGIQVSTEQATVTGRIEIEGNRIFWFPVVLPGDRNDFEPPNIPPINGPENTQYSHQFVFAKVRSYGQSIGYGADPVFADPDYGPFVVYPGEGRPGTSYRVEWAPANPREPVMDGVPFSEVIDEADGSPGLAFRITLHAHVGRGIVPRIEGIAFVIHEGGI